jgi:hypothetical protein
MHNMDCVRSKTHKGEQAMIKSYELRDEEHNLIRVFMSHEEALKQLTNGDYLVEKKSIQPPKISLYNLAVKKVGYADF